MRLDFQMEKLKATDSRSQKEKATPTPMATRWGLQRDWPKGTPKGTPKERAIPTLKATRLGLQTDWLKATRLGLQRAKPTLTLKVKRWGWQKATLKDFLTGTPHPTGSGCRTGRPKGSRMRLRLEKPMLTRKGFHLDFRSALL